MSGSEAQEGAGDPSMEDILASIRRILNDGEGEAHEPTAPPDRAVPTPSNATPSDDVFLLDQTMLIEEPAPMHDDTHASATAPHHEPPPSSIHQDPPIHEAVPPAPDYSPLDAGEAPPEPLLAPAAAAATAASLGALVRVVNQRQTPVWRDGPTLEDMVREELKPMVKSWLDENLAPLVERLVRAEIDRVSKGSA